MVHTIQVVTITILTYILFQGLDHSIATYELLHIRLPYFDSYSLRWLWK
jgi:hypothetical protein